MQLDFRARGDDLMEEQHAGMRQLMWRSTRASDLEPLQTNTERRIVASLGGLARVPELKPAINRVPTEFDGLEGRALYRDQDFTDIIPHLRMNVSAYDN
ncbi:hypothetical protein BGZ52_002337 [Haplosporangium bisporale]|nr:hypothetical protein BGZ52_002337 [Haplosporangium bisporale]